MVTLNSVVSNHPQSFLSHFLIIYLIFLLQQAVLGFLIAPSSPFPIKFEVNSPESHRSS